MIKFDIRSLNNLVENRISSSEFEIGTIKIGKNFNEIPKNEINDIYIINPKIEGYNFESSDFTITERLEQLNEFDGFVHLAGGINCKIENQKIMHLRLSRKYIELIKEYSMQEVLEYYGQPEYELIDDMAFGGFDYAIENYILVYENKNINFYFDPNTLKLKEINTNILNYKTYTIKK